MESRLPNRGLRPLVAVLCTATLAATLAACGGTSPTAAGTTATPTATATHTRAPSTTAAAAKAATRRCAETPGASARATVQWNPKVVGAPTIKAGQAVAFLTRSSGGPTVTEGSHGTADPNACVDTLLAAGLPMFVTFYKPGTYHFFCRKAPDTMVTVVKVT